jgi:hypothetical protein
MDGEMEKGRPKELVEEGVAAFYMFGDRPLIRRSKWVDSPTTYETSAFTSA